MSKPAMVERDLLVFSIWAVLGFGGLCLVLEGFARDSYPVSLAGIAAIVAAFVAHIIVNGIFNTGFRPGETALGISAFGILAVGFIGGWAFGELSPADYWAGLTLFAVLAFGLLADLSTRYGMRGAFSRFHLKQAGDGKPAG